MDNNKSKASTNITGANLKRLREANNMSLERLCELTKADLALKVSDIHAIEEQNHVVYDYELLCFAKLFNVTIDEFF